jgi:hypothetical protein
MFTLSFNSGLGASEKRLPDSLEVPRCSTDYLKYILYLLLEVLDVFIS